MQQLKRKGRTVIGVLLLVLSAGAQADVSKASDWLGRSVVTQDGEPLGRIEDMAVDIESAKIAFMVVSVGSFLIDDALIAVDPDALGPSADGLHLVLNSNDLKSAKRFNADRWPARADVLAAATEEPAPFVEAGDAAPQTDSSQGRAFISDGRRQATVAGGERKIEPLQRSQRVADLNPVGELRRASAVATDVAAIDAGQQPLPAFARIDSNGDGALDRNEFGPYLGLKERYQEIDLDSSGSLDEFEFELLKNSRGSAP